MKEEFRRYNERIEVSDEGNVKVDGKPYDLSKSNTVYKRVLSHYVHRMVAELFIPNPENKLYVDHIDGNRYNNKVTNLRWATSSENRLNPITVARFNKTVSSEESRNKRSNSLKQYFQEPPEAILHLKTRFISEETRTKISKANKDKKMSEETRTKISKANKDKKMSEESKSKISKEMKNRKYLTDGVWTFFAKPEYWGEFIDIGYHFGSK